MKNPVFRDSSQPLAVRVKDLISRMSLSEKVNQLTCITYSEIKDASVIQNGIGEVAMAATSNVKSSKEISRIIKDLQENIIERSPNGIPALFHMEALSGPMTIPDAVCYPAPCGLGAAFSPEDIRDMADRIRKQLVAVGIRHALSPVLDLARDFRWGRVNEAYGSDPTLVAAMSCAFVEGLQGNQLNEGVAATAKHFIGYSQTEGGLNMSKVLCDKRDIRESFAKPFEAAIRISNLKTVMSAYSSIDGTPICCSKRVLDDLLRNDLGFDGFVVSDYFSIRRLIDSFKMTDDLTQAAIWCLEAGMDMELPGKSGYGNNLIEAVKMGYIEEFVVDRSLERILSLKFELGLFENPYPNLQKDNFNNVENIEHIIEVTRKTMTLTKNDGILPVKDFQKKIAVIGPSGDDFRVMFGTYMFGCVLEKNHLAKKTANISNAKDYSFYNTLNYSKIFKHQWSDAEFRSEVNSILSEAYPEVKSVFGALNERFKNISYTRGCDFSDSTDCDFSVAVNAAQNADIVIMAVGGKNGWGKHCTGGELVDATRIELHGRQHELIKKVFDANPNMIVVHLDNKPLVDEFVYNNARAVLEAWIPGIYGAQAIADVLTGNYNPGGRLNSDVPHSTGQLPLYHYQYNGNRISDDNAGVMVYNGYVNESSVPARPFGYGLSYTCFEYSNFISESTVENEIPIITILVDVCNAGCMRGDETVQLYGKDLLASVIRPSQELIGFKRVTLQPGERKTIKFIFRLDQLAFINLKGEWVIEKGDFAFFVGRNSLDVQFEVIFKQEKTLRIDNKHRGFFAKAEIL